MTTTTAVLDALEGESFAVLTDTITVLDGGATPYEIFEVSGPRASGPPPHDHAWAETYFMLDGEIDVVVGDECRRVGPGARVHIPARTLHTFAVATLLGWYRAGEDVAAKIPALSTYLGHREPSSTYWYLSAAPELLALAAERLEHHPAGDEPTPHRVRSS